MRLYDLTEAYQNISALIEHGDLNQEELAQVIDTLTDSIQEKAGNIALMIQNMNADVVSLKAEETRLHDRRVALENKVIGLKTYLQDNLTKTGVEKVKTPTHSIWIQNNPPSVKIHNQDIIPKEYMTHIEEWNPNKEAILKAIDSGLEVPGAERFQGKGLRIR